MARTDEEITAQRSLYYAAEAAILQNIADDRVNAAGIRDYAEAYALLTGKLAAKPVTIKNG